MKEIIYNRYEICDDSNIFDMVKNKYLNKSTNKGFVTVDIYCEGKRKKLYLHKLMVETFISIFDSNNHNIQFVNDNKRDCSLNNLQLIDKQKSDQLPIGLREKIFENYEIDTTGYIYNNKTGNVLLSSPDKNGFLRVGLKDKDKLKMYSIHKLMVEKFLIDYNEKTDLIKFIDSDKKNCSLNNLIILKNAKIQTIPDQEMNIYFEKQDPYSIVDYYIKFIYSRGRNIALTNSFTIDDLKQYLVTYLWKKMPYYFIKASHIDFKCYAFSVFNNLMKNKGFWHHITSFYSVIKTSFNSFDAYDSPGSYISPYEAVQVGIFEKKQGERSSK